MKNDMSLDEFKRLFKLGKTDKIRALEHSSVGELLLLLMGEYEDSLEPVNFDRLMGIGIVLARAGTEDVDVTALHWLLQQPSSRRVDIVSALLNGFWKANLRRIPVPPERVEMLLQGGENTELSNDAEFSFIQVLCQIMQPDASLPIRARIRDKFREVLQRPIADWETVMRSVISDALHRAG